MKNISTLLFTLFIGTIFSQIVDEKIVIQELSENEIQLKSIDTPLTQIAGAPEPFYTYWWEFGDGNYSRSEFPTHSYFKKGNYDILLARTNNYDDGKGRPIKKKGISITKGALAFADDNNIYMGENENLELSKNQDPKPNEKMVFVQSYKNNSTTVQMGTILFFYNESSFENKHFDLLDSRLHFNEEKFNSTKNEASKLIDSLITNDETSYNSNDFKDFIDNYNHIDYNLSILSKDEQTEIQNFRNTKNLKTEVLKAFDKYSNVIALKFNDLNPSEERNIFLTLQATAEMLTDTNVTISVESFFIPNNMQYATKVKENMPVVTAHDPNKLIVNKSKTFNAFTKKNDITYEIKFQNVGKGPAEEVKLRFYNNAGIDIKNVNIIDFEPKCELCSENCNGSYIDTTVTKEYVEFYFHNIYLPGTRQADIESRKASKGYVKFSLNTKKRIKQDNLTCRTEIYFDNEDPIRTNNATTKFQKRAYFGLETGASYLPLSFPRADIFLRGTFTYRLTNSWYYRAEIGATYVFPVDKASNQQRIDTIYRDLYFGNFEIFDDLGELHIIDSVKVNHLRLITNVNDVTKVQEVKIDVVPLEFRKDITKFLSVGFGLSTKLNLVSFNSRHNIRSTEVFDAIVTTDTIFTPVYIAASQQPISYDVDFEISNVSLEKDNNLTLSVDEKTSFTEYNLDFSSGLFLDINIGRNYSIPYVGLRAKVDYNFTYQNIKPALQIYIGANF